MFDFGLGELLLLAVVALVVLGPEKLPHAARMAGAWAGRLRRMVIDIQADIEKEVALQELRASIKKQIDAAGTEELRQQLEEQLRMMEASLRPPQSSSTRPSDDA